MANSGIELSSPFALKWASATDKSASLVVRRHDFSCKFHLSGALSFLPRTQEERAAKTLICLQFTLTFLAIFAR